MLYVHLDMWDNIANNKHLYTFVTYNENGNNIIYKNDSHIANATSYIFEKCQNIKFKIYYINEHNDKIEIMPTSLFIELYFY